MIAKLIRVGAVGAIVSVGALASACSASSTPNASAPLPRIQPCIGKPQIKPSSYTIACADAGIYLKSMRWKSWTNTKAIATGQYWQNDCTPSCAAGKFHGYPATITLSNPKSTKSGKVFADMSVSYTVSGKPKAYVTTLPLKSFG